MPGANEDSSIDSSRDSNCEGGEGEVDDGSEMWFDINPDAAENATAPVSSGRNSPVAVVSAQDYAACRPASVNDDSATTGHIFEVQYPQGHTFQVRYPENDAPSGTENRAKWQRDVDSAASTCPGSPARFHRAPKMTRDGARAALQAATERQAAAGAAYEAAAAEAAQALSVAASFRPKRKAREPESRLAAKAAKEMANKKQIDADIARSAVRAAGQKADVAIARAWVAGACPILKPVRSVIDAVLCDSLLELEYCKRHHRWRNEILGAPAPQAAGNEDLPKVDDGPGDIQDSSKLYVIFCGKGGVGWRAAHGCFGSRSKHNVVRSSGCRLVERHSLSETTLEFQVAGFPTIPLSNKTRVATKGAGDEARVELALEDGRYIWLWRVPSEARAVILGLVDKHATSWTRSSSNKEKLLDCDQEVVCCKHEEQQTGLDSQLGFDTSRGRVSDISAGFLPAAADAVSSKPLNCDAMAASGDGQRARVQVPKLRLYVLNLHGTMAQVPPQRHSSAARSGVCCLTRCSSSLSYSSSSTWLSSGCASPTSDSNHSARDTCSPHPTLHDASLELASQYAQMQAQAQANDGDGAPNSWQPEGVLLTPMQHVQDATPPEACSMRPASPAWYHSPVWLSGGPLPSSFGQGQHFSKQMYREPTPTLQHLAPSYPTGARPPKLSNLLR